MTSEPGAPRNRFGIPPMTTITAAIVVGLAVAALVTVLALRQPWLGLRDGSLSSWASISDGSKSMDFEKLDFTIEPDGAMGDYATYDRFLTRQDSLARIQSAATVTLMGDAGASRVVHPDRSGRPVSSLPTEFWVQVFVGLAAWLVSAAVFAFRPRETSARYLLLSGAATLVFAPAAALYSTRELALPGTLFRWANDLNFLGGSLFAASLVSLLLYYPRKIAPRWVGVAVVALYVGWWVAQQAGIFEDMTLARRLLVMVGMAATFVLSGIHWFLTRRDPVARAALQWFLLSWVLGSGMFGIFILLPQLFGIDTSSAQGYGFLLFLLVYVGLAFGITRYRLFQMGEWWRQVMVWLLGVLLLVLFDAIFLLGLHLSSAISLSLALLICGMIWLPLRGWLWRRISGRGEMVREDLFSRVVDVALTPPGRGDRNAGWRELLGSVFDPMAISPAPTPPQQVTVSRDGSMLELPAMETIQALRLEHARGGRCLFGPADIARAEEMITMLGHATGSRNAFAEGVSRERDRIARDIHDNIGAHLLAALHSATADEKDVRIRDAVSDLRDVINDTRGRDLGLDEALAQLRLETADRLSDASISLKWTSQSDGSVVPDLAMIPELRAVLREAVSNVIRHSFARQAVISICGGRGKLTLEIADDGCGFDPDLVRAGHGLANMRSRLQALGGQLRMADAVGLGTRLIADFPNQKKPDTP